MPDRCPITYLVRITVVQCSEERRHVIQQMADAVDATAIAVVLEELAVVQFGACFAASDLADS